MQLVDSHVHLPLLDKDGQRLDAVLARAAEVGGGL